MDQRTELSEFLRSRRARLQPQDVGLAHYGGRRRVPGLRREELAQLAGVSVAYYTRLEQGHAENVSTTVLDAIAGALRLTPAEREHLSRLVRPVSGRSRATVRPQRIRPELQQLLDTMHPVPTCVLGRRLDVLAWNPLYCALFGDYATLPPEQRNLAWQLFRDPASRELFVDWDGKAADVVASLRLEAGRYPDDPRLCALVGELSVKSEDFRRLWAIYNVHDKGHGSKELHHPVVGRLLLRYETLALPADPDQVLLTYHAEPGSASAESLRLLASWWASSEEPEGSRAR
ncbi:helix-turn-helix transcriptional regulator [Kitasatospora sp. NBC_01287]|uniref:helix-turn-helix domain-containing protein n=1 Tax=Kitasatospora sp. NBC_01287 TaxID=2903573 RepID=UPI00225A6EB1|nr:helix-turn-helix transcriptional regulator [Kitasatospora sp. NBC_01287]MCX4749971.1 helix-turn-helix transcriptional regulator [Kitasatospora sp. NBC_01287]